MKNFNKLVAFLLAAAMVLSLVVIPSFADDPTPTPPTKGTITIRNATPAIEYKAYKLFDVVYGEPVIYDYDPTPAPSTSPSAAPDTIISGVSYSYTKADSDAFYDAFADDDSPFKFTETSTANVYSVTLKDGVTDADVIEFIKENQKTIEDNLTGIDVSELKDGQAIFKNLDFGYYFVTSSLGTEVTIDTTTPNVVIVDKNEKPSVPTSAVTPDPSNTPSIVTPVPTPTPTGMVPTPVPTETPADMTPTPAGPDNPLYPSDVLIYPGKTIVEDGGDLVDVNSANFNDYLHFGYSLNAVAYADPPAEYADTADDDDEQNKTKLVTYYYVKDTMDQGFDIVKDRTVENDTVVANKMFVRVITYKQDESGNKVIDTVRILGENEYSITYSEDAANGYEAETFFLTIPWGEKYGATATITLDYYVKVTDKVKIAEAGTSNKINFSYEIDPNFDPNDGNKTIENPEYDPLDPGDEPPTIPYEPPYDPKDPSGFPGPYDPTGSDPEPAFDPNTEEETKTFVYAVGLLKVDKAGEKLSVAKFKLQRKDGDNWVDVPVKTQNDAVTKAADPAGVYAYDKSGTSTELITPDTGDVKAEIIVKGLAEGTYRFIETEAPEGYNIQSADDVAELTIALDGDLTTASDDAMVIKNTVKDADETVDERISAGVCVVNQKGVELPATGGMGTVIFIGVGAALFLVTAIVLVTKKRLYNEG